MQLEQLPVIGPIGPHYDNVDAPYWEGLAIGELRLQRCAQCEAWIWGANWRCGECGGWDLNWEQVPMRGRVFSWIRTHQAFAPEMASLVPYVTVLVELPQAGGRRVMGLLIGNEAGLSIGAEVNGVIQPASALTSGQPVLRWQLRHTKTDDKS